LDDSEERFGGLKNKYYICKILLRYGYYRSLNVYGRLPSTIDSVVDSTC
jgi:hypothetical protein